MNTNGFTIIEVLIFLAIAGTMFIFGIDNLLSTQQKDQFLVVVGSIKSEIQSSILKASEGNYNLPASYSCSNGPNNRLAITPLSSSTNNDPNPNCMFIGTAFLMTQNSANQSVLNILPVFGNTFSNGSITSSPQPNSTSLSEALPITDAALNNQYVLSSVVSVSKFGFNDTISNAFQPINGFLVFNNFNQYSRGSTSLLSTSSQISEDVPILPYVKSSSLNEEINAVNQITDSSNCSQNTPSTNTYACQISSSTSEILNSAAPINPPNGIELCLEDQGGNESDLISIGGQGVNSLRTIVDKLFSGTTCGI